MNKIRLVMTLAVLLATAGGACAQVNKCTDASGKVSYSEQACTDAQRGGQVLGREATRMDPERDRYNAQLHRESLNRTMQGQRELIDGPPPSAEDEARYEAPRPAPAPYNPNKLIDEQSERNMAKRMAELEGGRRQRADQQQEQQQQRRQRQGPTSFSGCDTAGCWGNNGVHYSRVAGGNMAGSDGSFCSTANGQNFSCR
jgi:hypothetical protein